MTLRQQLERARNLVYETQTEIKTSDRNYELFRDPHAPSRPTAPVMTRSSLLPSSTPGTLLAQTVWYDHPARAAGDLETFSKACWRNAIFETARIAVIGESSDVWLVVNSQKPLRGYIESSGDWSVPFRWPQHNVRIRGGDQEYVFEQGPAIPGSFYRIADRHEYVSGVTDLDQAPPDWDDLAQGRLRAEWRRVWVRGTWGPGRGDVDVWHAGGVGGRRSRLSRFHPQFNMPGRGPAQVAIDYVLGHSPYKTLAGAKSAETKYLVKQALAEMIRVVEYSDFIDPELEVRGFGFHGVDEMWTGGRHDADEYARVWLAHGFSPEDALGWMDNARVFSPIHAVALRLAGLRPDHFSGNIEAQNRSFDHGELGYEYCQDLLTLDELMNLMGLVHGGLRYLDHPPTLPTRWPGWRALE